MQKDLEKFSTTDLRRMLINEIKRFIFCLEFNAVEELEEMRTFIKHIFDVLEEKENKEKAPLNWGKNSTQFGNDDLQSHSIDEIAEKAGN